MHCRSRSFRSAILLGLSFASVLIACGNGGTPPHQRELRVCADPNNLPFSNRRGEGYENRIARLVARELRTRLTYVWWPQRRGFIRNTLDAGRCDVVLGVPAIGYGAVLATLPYYRSTYVFVSRRDRDYRIRSLDDSILRRLRIGLQFTGGGANPPPAAALARRHMVSNVVGYSMYGNYADPNPPARLIDAVAAGEIDVAIAWGPLAGYFAQHEPALLVLAPVTPSADGPGASFVFDIAMGVRRGDAALRDELQGVLDRRQRDIRQILQAYGIPLVP